MNLRSYNEKLMLTEIGALIGMHLSSYEVRWALRQHQIDQAVSLGEWRVLTVPEIAALTGLDEALVAEMGLPGVDGRRRRLKALEGHLRAIQDIMDERSASR